MFLACTDPPDAARLKCCLCSAMHQVLSLRWRDVAPMPHNRLSYLLASLPFINLAGQAVCAVFRSCVLPLCLHSTGALPFSSCLLFPVRMDLLVCVQAAGLHPSADCVASCRDAWCIDSRTGLLPSLPGSGPAPLPLPVLCRPSPIAACLGKAARDNYLEDLELRRLGTGVQCGAAASAG